MEGAGLERSEADAAALREVGFDTWEALAFAQREWADAERDRSRRGHPESTVGAADRRPDFDPIHAQEQELVREWLRQQARSFETVPRFR